jgi:predicted ATPase/class 3 adenylate cyclase/DNA-binding CsgD family transcriptional regulator
MSDRLLTGTLTFLFTDIESSTSLWEREPVAMREALKVHDQVIERLVEQHHGQVVRPRGEGDSRFAVFSSALAAVLAAVHIQRALAEQSWDTSDPLRVRIGLHTGEADVRDGDYYGAAPNRCARLRSLAKGGQILVSSVTAGVVGEDLPDEITLSDRGVHQLKNLLKPEHVFQLVDGALQVDLLASGAGGTNIPAPITSFIGREAEVEHVRQLLASTRLLTLTGTGGTGKTRLALHTIAQVIRCYPDGVWFVDLAGLTQPDLVPNHIAAAIGVREGAGRAVRETLADALRSKDLLLALDNCEHLVEACASVVGFLLQACPSVHFLATSREVLRVPGETAWQVPPMRLVDVDGGANLDVIAGCEAVKLFVDRATAVDGGFAIDHQNANAILTICRRLDSIPLAIELASAHIRVLTPDEILNRLDHRFKLLRRGGRTQTPRQQTLRGLIDWSFELLSPAEKTVFRRASAFSGGWVLSAAEIVCAGDPIESADVLDHVGALVDKSMVVVEEGDIQKRYRLLETLREYALDRLVDAGEYDQTMRRHGQYFLTLAREAESELVGPKSRHWLQRLQLEIDNFRVALAWALEAEPISALRIAGSLGQFWYATGLIAEGRQWLRRVEAHFEPAPADDVVRVLAASAKLAFGQGDYTSERAYLEAMGSVRRSQGDPAGEAAVLASLGSRASERGDFAEARSYWEQSVRLHQEAIETGESPQMSLAKNLLALLALEETRMDDALAIVSEATKLAESRNEEYEVNVYRWTMAQIALERRDIPRAAALLHRSLAWFEERRALVGISQNLWAVAALANADNKLLLASKLVGASAATEERAGFTPPPMYRRRRDRIVSQLEARGGKAYVMAFDIGRKWSLNDAVEAARAVLESIERRMPKADAVRTTTLSHREKEVAVLAARGLTNAEIAQMLVVGERTVESHVSHVLAKLQLATRTQLAAWARHTGELA